MAKLKLSGWSPKTDRLLLSNDGSDGYDIIDHTLEALFPQHLMQELRANGCLGRSSEKQDDGDNNGMKSGRLVPARTAVDVNLQSLLGGFLDENTNNDDVSSNVRGDEATFISREERSQPDFPENYPFLHRLICSIEDTVTKADSTIQQHFEFDTTQTSVQLARYRGDNKSGYPRHCDRGMTCTQEVQHDNNNSDGKMQRLLTFVYYLTPSDWDEHLDGGALRMYLPQRKNRSEETNDDNCYLDVTQNANRDDYLLYHAAQRNLDKTIDALRRQRVEENVKLLKRLRLQNEEECASQAIYPCPAPEDDQKKRLHKVRAKQSCYSKDYACGHACTDVALADHAEAEWANITSSNQD